MSLTRKQRGEYRAKIEQPLRVRLEDGAGEADLCRTLNVSKNGIYFVSEQNVYYAGLHVHLVLGYREGDPVVKEWIGEVLRAERREDGRTGIAVRILMR